MDLSSSSRSALDALACANNLAEQTGLFPWTSTQLCNFLAIHNILAAPGTFRGTTQTQCWGADMLSPLLERHDGYSRDPHAQMAGQLEY
jgi:hypothetical protein